MHPETGLSNLWAHPAPDAPPAAALEGGHVADVAIIGAGFTGLSAALHLAETGVRVVVLEAREIGHGGSGRNAGLVNAGMWVRPDDLVATLGPEFGQRLITELGDAPTLVYDLAARHEMACEAVRAGTLHMAAGETGLAEIRARHAQWAARGAPVELLDEAAARALTGAEGYAGALLDRRAGTIQPLAYARGLARAAQRAGATLHTGSPVVAARRDGRAYRLETPGGHVAAPWIVVATNAYCGLESAAPFGEHRRELIALPYFQFATAPLAPAQLCTILPMGHGAWDTRLVMRSFRRDAAGRLVFGSIGALDGVSRAAHAAFARRALAQTFPHLGDVAFEHFWHGEIGMTDDHLPRFHLTSENVVTIDGYNGRGIAPGTVFGHAIARYIAGDRTAIPLPEWPIRPAALRAARSAYYRFGAHIAHLATARR